MKFVQIKSKSGLHWALLIDNRTDFERFLKDKAKDLTNAYLEAKDSALKWGYATHVSTVAYCIAAELERHSDRETAIDDIMIYTNTFLKPFISAFVKYKKILVWEGESKWQKQKYAGFMAYEWFENHIEKMEIIKTIEKDELEFPKKSDIKVYNKDDISINKWADGVHFYAKVGNIDVVVDNEVKWNTSDMAMEKAKEFLKDLNKGK